MDRLKKPIKYRVEYFFTVVLMRVIQTFPRRCGITVLSFVINIFYILAKKHRTNMIHHLTLAFGSEKTEDEILKIARDVPRHFAVAVVDTVRIPNIIREGFDRYVKAENLHILDTAMKTGKGAVILTGHFGNWELMGAYMAQQKYPIRVVGAPLKNPLLDKLLVNMRNNAGYRSVHRGRSAKAFLRILKQGGFLGILIDQDIKKINGVFVDFFGKKAYTPTGPVMFALRFGIPIIPMFIHLEKDLTYHIQCFDPIRITNTGNPENDIKINTQMCSDVYEAVIRRHPEQWAWIHRRWNQKPEANDIQSDENELM
jgi:Kdo2-lipid IVA lauroyltransferase/acyltransferase